MSIKSTVISILFILIVICSIGSVFAADNNTVDDGSVIDDSYASDNSNNYIISNHSNSHSTVSDISELKSDALLSNDSKILGNSNNNDVLSSGTATNYNELVELLKNGGTITLSNNIIIENTLKINVDGTVVDGAGYTVNGDNKYQIFDVTADNVVIKNIKLINGYSTSSAGAVYWERYSDNGTMINVTFANNTASYGAAVYCLGANSSIINSTFISNTANSSAGAIYFDKNDCKVINSTFINNTARDNNGGALYWCDARGVLLNSTFINNHAGNGGGAIQWNGVNGTVSNSTFVNNTAGFGGAVYWYGLNGIVHNSIFIDNFVDVKGGAAIFWNEINGLITNSDFINNTANRSSGGAITLAGFGDNTTIFNSRFINNTARFGGAIDVNSDNDSLYNSIFINNTAESYAGAVAWRNVNGTLINSTFINNTAATYAGAVYWDYINGTMVNSTFISNSALNGDGGAVYWNSRSVNGTIVNSNFTNNSAKNYGGAIYYSVVTVNMENSTFANNTADNGGAIYVDRSKVTLNNTSLTGNKAVKGSALYVYYGNLIIKNAELLNNRANSSNLVIRYNNSNSNASVTLSGWDNLFNGIYSDSNITVSNLTYYDVNGIRNTGTSAENYTPISNNEKGMNITVVVTRKYDNKILINTTETTDENGTVTVNIDRNQLQSGDYTIYAIHNGDSYYTEIDNSIILNVPRTNTVTNVNATNVSYGNDVIISVNVSQNTRIFDITGNVTINVNGTSYNVNLTNGTATLILPDLNSGKYNVTVRYNGDNNYRPSSNTSTFTVSKIDTSLVVSVDNVTYPGDAVVDVVLSGADGVKLSGVVVVTVGGADYNVNVVDGVGSVVVSGLDAGDYVVNASFAGNDNYNPSANSTVFNVAKLPTNINISVINVTYPDNETINITLVDLNNNPLNGNITLTIDNNTYDLEVIDGKTSFTTDSLKPDDYNVTVNYKGDVNYLPSNNTVIFTVFKHPTGINITANRTGNKTLFTLQLSELINDDVVVNLNNRNYTVNLVNGSGLLEIDNLPAGKYNVTVNYKGNDYYLGSDNNTNTSVTVNETNTNNTNNTNNTSKTNNNTNNTFVNNNTKSYSNNDISFTEENDDTADTIAASPETGNPLYVLVMALIILGILPLRRRK